MSDIFREVDEEVRREKLKQLWERHSNLIVALALLIVLGVGGWRGYDWWETRKSAESGAAFEAARPARRGRQAGRGAGRFRQARQGRKLAAIASSPASARPPSLPRPIRRRPSRPTARWRPTSSLGRTLQDLADRPRRPDPGRYRAARRTDRAARAADRGGPSIPPHRARAARARRLAHRRSRLPPSAGST